MLVLGLENTCDETSVSILNILSQKIIKNLSVTQVSLHNIYGGVVPKLTKIYHNTTIFYLYTKIIDCCNLYFLNINYIAFVFEPGIINSLDASYTINILSTLYSKVNLIKINHIEGHLLSSMKFKNFFVNKKLNFYIISGGHTNLISFHTLKKYYNIINSQNTSIGNCFDKLAMYLNLSYTGGPKLEALFFFYKKPIFTYKKIREKNTKFDSIKYFFKKKENLTNKLTHKKVKYAFLLHDNIFKKLFIDILQFRQKPRFTIGGGVSSNILLKSFKKYFLKINVIYISYSLKKIGTDNGFIILCSGLINFFLKNYIETSFFSFNKKSFLV